MIDLLAQATSVTTAPSTGDTTAGPFGPLVIGITCAMTAISLILVQVLRGWKKWKPVGEFFPNSAIRFAALFSAGAMVLAFFFLRTPDAVATLTGTLIVGAVGALVSLIAYNILYARWVFTYMPGVNQSGQLVTIDILGGFLTVASRAKLAADPNLTEQMLIDGCEGKLDRVWKRGSRGIVASFFLVAFVLLITFGALTATAIGLFTLILSGVVKDDPLHVRVPASVMLSEPVQRNEIVVGNGGFIEIPAHSRAVFISATTQKWTGDRLNRIEGLLSTTQPYSVDVTRLVKAYDAAADKENDFLKWMRGEFEVLVDEKWTSPTATQAFPGFEALAEAYVRANVYKDIANPAKRPGNRYAIDLHGSRA
jgi:hypothetical protein